MKCPICKGDGTSNICINGTFLPCSYCDGKGTVEELTNAEWLRSCSDEELAGAIYEWYSLGFTRGKNGKKLNSITEVVNWLKEAHE